MKCRHIVWLNGPFGAGKTTTAHALHRRLPGSFVLDPEETGFYLRRCQPKAMHAPDFQDDPLWLEFNLKLLARVAERHPGPVIVPMTLWRPEIYHALVTALRGRGIRVDHFILTASPGVLRRRLRSRADGPRSWAARHLERCLAAFAAPPFEGHVDTDGLSIPAVAEAVAARAGLTLMPRDRLPGSFAMKNLMTSLRHIRWWR